MADLKNELDRILQPMLDEGIDPHDALAFLLVALYAWAVDHRQLPRVVSSQVQIALQVRKA